ncbi:hypothetical protein QLS71_006410 [Mariniflexile litorale]|uniref:DKNYY family protein n=1 Tax=Mariniflexile litorale TaxID=3045158 RepID=A0AAU7EJI6_9FLAO|nr:hypothetical protein [Mariniflexile sp. KMM 9835]MDQ8211419.1 hypothetical protein [Mariniflexile sp. KMM 9835]
MSKLFRVLIVFCLVNVSCKTDIDSKIVNECELFKIGNFKFYNPRVYDHPIIFEKGSHNLLDNHYVPVWYPGYCAIYKPSYFKSKEDYLKYVADKNIKYRSLSYYENLYEENRTNLKGLKENYHEDYHLLYRGTVSVKNVSSGNHYLLVAGRNYISEVSDYDKNTEFYEGKVSDMFAFIEEDGVYKSVDIDLVVGQFNKEQLSKVYDILSAKRLVKTVCVETVNTLMKTDFNSSTLPAWVSNKSELDE